MNPAEEVACGLAERFTGIDGSRLLHKPVFREAAELACALMPPEKVVALVADDGGLDGARDASAVLIGRLRRLPELVAERRRLAEHRDASRRRRHVETAARRGESLRALVSGGRLYADEALTAITGEFTDADLRAVAVAALEGQDG